MTAREGNKQSRPDGQKPAGGSGEEFFEGFGGEGGVGLAAGGFHHLADEVHEGGLLAGAVVGGNLGVGVDGLAGESFDGGGVGDLREAAFFDDGGGVAAVFEEFGEDLLGGWLMVFLSRSLSSAARAEGVMRASERGTDFSSRAWRSSPMTQLAAALGREEARAVSSKKSARGREATRTEAS